MKPKNASIVIYFGSIIFLFLMSSAISAQNYIVSGAGNLAANGVYVNNGTMNTKPHFIKTGSPNYYMYYVEMDGAWVIATQDNIPMFFMAVYYNSSSADTPPTNGWESMGPGEPPTVGIAGPMLTYSASFLRESISNDGSIDNSSPIIITHNNYGGSTFNGIMGENFAASDPVKLQVSNLPDGLTVVATITSTTTISVAITGNAASHANANDMSNLTFAFLNSAFSTGDASSVTSATKSNLEVNFIEQLNVGAGQTITEAIGRANDGDIIYIPAGIYLVPNLSFSNKSLHFVGENPSTTILQANTTYNPIDITETARVMYCSFTSYSIFNQVSLDNLTLRYGKTVPVPGSGQGGAGMGAAFFSQKTNVSINNCEIVSNVHDDLTYSWGGAGGGGILVQEGSLNITGSTFANNSAHMRVEDGVPGCGGGAILFNSGGISSLTLNITNCTFSNNSCNTSGGAILGIFPSSPSVSIVNSTFSGNSGEYGGAFCSSNEAAQSLIVKNCIFNGNTATLNGTDLYSNNTQTAAITTCLMQNTSAGGIALTAFDDFTKNNTTLNPNFSSAGLHDNGGPTRTIALLSGSPAINAGTTSGAPSTDQRGGTRDGSPDIGAYEFGATPLPVELAAFSAILDKDAVVLNWRTATEVNNYGFEIERRSENSAWEKIGFVAGHGNSNSPNEYSFTDENPSAGKSLYRLKQLDSDGKSKYYDAVSVSVDAPKTFKLMQNSPNPFNPSTAIKFQLPVSSMVNVKVYDMMGREVTSLVNEEKPAGSHIVYWNGRDNSGQMVSSGVYLYRISAGSYSETRKMNLLK